MVSHTELGRILGQFENSLLGSVKASVLDAMRLQAAEKKKRSLSPEPTQGPSGAYACNIISDSESEDEDAHTADSDIECW